MRTLEWLLPTPKMFVFAFLLVAFSPLETPVWVQLLIMIAGDMIDARMSDRR